MTCFGQRCGFYCEYAGSEKQKSQHLATPSSTAILSLALPVLLSFWLRKHADRIVHGFYLPLSSIFVCLLSFVLMLALLGTLIVSAMVNQKIYDIFYKRSQQVVTMATACRDTVRIDGDTITVDPQLLFQRLVSAGGENVDKKKDIFKYELTGYPTSLFESGTSFRPPSKADLADEMWKAASTAMPVLPSMDIHHVVDWEREGPTSSDSMGKGCYLCHYRTFLRSLHHETIQALHCCVRWLFPRPVDQRCCTCTQV